MAFWKTIKHTGQPMCNICRKPYSEGISVDYVKDQPVIMCKQCFQRCFKNNPGGRNAANIDSPKNFKTQYRPAQILEKPRFLNMNEPRGGYEFAVPIITELQLVRDILVWFIAICLLEHVFTTTNIFPYAHVTYSFGLIGLLICKVLVSLAWFIKDIGYLFKGICKGMGHIRRILLLVTCIILAIMTYNGVTALIGYLT